MVVNRSVIILGLGPSGLFLTRQLHKLTNRIYAIGRTDDVGMYSKYINKTHRYYASTVDELVSALKEISRITDDKPLLFISSDQYLTLMLSDDIDWSQYAEIAGAGFETLKLINDKNTIVEYCKSHDIRIPQSFSFAEFLSIDNPCYPIIVKPNEKQLHPKKNPIGKIRICRTQKEFEILCQEMTSMRTDANEFHIQTYIEGTNAQQYSIGGYYSHGEPMAEIVVNQIMQYPQGISALVHTSDGDSAKRICHIARELAKDLSYSGFMEVEFKIDKVSQQPYLLDVNPRPWGWISAFGSAYNDFYRVFEGEKVQNPYCPVIWRSPIRRYLSFLNKNNVRKVVRKSGFVKAYDIFDASDLKPSIMIYVIALKKILK